jgi:tRNA nucleotidyltransferase (CCA-adding enzyme)
MEIITTHLNADFDAFSSMVAAKKLYPQAELVFPGGKEPGLSRFLDSGLFPFHELPISEIDLSRVSRLIVVDIKQASRIGKLAELVDRPGVEVIVYDHHPPKEGDIKGDEEHVEGVGATSTIFVHLFKEKGVSLDPLEATVMALGIYEDTGFLTFPTTREDDLLAAAQLVASGANLEIVSRFLHRELTSEQFSLLNRMIASSEQRMISGHRVVISVLSSEEYIDELSLIVHRYVDMESIPVFFALVGISGAVCIVARSRELSVDVGEVASLFGGGGHPSAASAIVKGKTIIEVKEELLRLLREKLPPIQLARDIMSPYVRFIEMDKTVAVALSLMNQLRVNALPVLSQGAAVGMITRQLADRAIFHGLGDSRVSEVMQPEVEIIPPRASLDAVERMMIEGNRRFILVGEDPRSISGIITRMELFRHLYALKAELSSKGRRPFVKNLASLLKKRLPSEVFRILDLISDIAVDLGLKVYLVGGIVRDILLDIENIDLDVVVEGDGIAFGEELARRVKGRARTHDKFGTAVVVFPDGFKVDVATARTEYYEQPAALPQIQQSILRHDLFRRDFTINTMAVSLNRDRFGELIDFFGGVRDIRERVIRVLHSLSFIEDPTRAFRAVRFKHRFHFEIEKNTLSLIKKAVKRGVFTRLSGKRILSELSLIFSEEHPVSAFEELASLKLVHLIHPKIVFDEEMRRLLYSIEAVLSWYRLLYRKEEVDPSLVYLMGMFDRLSRKERLELTERLSLTGRRRELILSYRRTIYSILRELSRKKELPPSRIYLLLQPHPLELQLFAMAKSSGRAASPRISLFIRELSPVQLEITGRDLISRGASPGPRVGEILFKVLLAKLNGKVKGREEELSYAKGLI